LEQWSSGLKNGLSEWHLVERKETFRTGEPSHYALTRKIKAPFPKEKLKVHEQ
jgi:hypothetical protein